MAARATLLAMMLHTVRARARSTAESAVLTNAFPSAAAARALELLLGTLSQQQQQQQQQQQGQREKAPIQQAGFRNSSSSSRIRQPSSPSCRRVISWLSRQHSSARQQLFSRRRGQSSRHLPATQ